MGNCIFNQLNILYILQTQKKKEYFRHPVNVFKIDIKPDNPHLATLNAKNSIALCDIMTSPYVPKYGNMWRKTAYWHNALVKTIVGSVSWICQ